MSDLTLPQEQDTVVEDLTAGEKAFFPAGQNLEAKTSQASVAMPDRDIQELKNTLANGGEDVIRRDIAANVDAKKYEAARQLIFDVAQSGMPVDTAALAAAATVDPTDPGVALEQQFVLSSIDTNIAMSKNKDVQAQAASWDGFLTDPWSDMAIKEQQAKNIVRDYRQRYENMGYGPWAVAGAVYMTGLPSWANMVRTGESGLKADSYTQGEATQEKAQKLWSLPPNEFHKAFKTEMEQLFYNNPFDAMAFAEYVTNPSDSQARFDTLAAIASLPIAGAVRSGLKATKMVKTMRELNKPSKSVLEALGEKVPKDKQHVLVPKESILKKAVSDITRVLAKDNVQPEHVLNVAGNTREAANVVLQKELARSESATGFARSVAPNASPLRQQQYAQLVEQMPDFWNPQLRYSGADTFHAKIANELIGRTNKNVEVLKSAFAAMGRVSTTTPEMFAKAVSNAENELFSRIPNFVDHLMEVKVYSAENNLGSAQIEAVFGGTDGALASVEDAQQLATQVLKLPEGSYLISQEGAGFYVNAYKDVAETGNGIDELILTSANTSKGYDSIATRPFDWLAGAKEHVSQFQNEQRFAAVQSFSAMENRVKDLMKPIFDLKTFGGEKKFKDFEKILTIGRDTERVPGDPTTIGKWYKNVGELGEAYVQHLKRIPSELEVNAYFNYVMLNDLDYSVRSIALAKSKVKRGVTAWEVPAFDLEGTKKSIYLEGTSLNKLPPSNDVSFLHIQESGANVTRKFNKLPDGLRADLEKAVEEGKARVIKLDDAENALIPILGNEADRVAYVVVHDAKETPIKVNKQLNYNPGGHTIYKPQWGIRQPHIESEYKLNDKGEKELVSAEYRGDQTLLGASTKAEAEDVAKRIGTALELYNKKDPGLDNFLRNNLPWTPEQFAEEIRLGRIKKDMPVAAVKFGSYTAEAGVRFHDGSFFTQKFGGVDPVSMAAFEDTYKGTKDFTQARNGPLQTLRRGGQGEPLWQLQNADKVAPLAAMTNTMGRLIKNAVYEDYQFEAARSWIEEFGNGVNPKAPGLKYNGKQLSMEELRKNPLFYLKHAEVSTSDPLRMSQAEKVRSHIINLVSQPSWLGRQIETFKHQVLADTLYKKGYENIANVIADKDIPFLQDPFSYARAMAFHMKLGLFNPIQLFIQGTSALNSVAFSPVYAMKAAPASLVMRSSLLTESPKILDHMASIAAKTSGFDRASFLDARRWLKEFNLEHVGNENALNYSADPTIFRSKAGHVFFDKGPMFFNEGERAARLQAWMTSYLEYVSKNPKAKGRLTLQQAKEVGVRAQMMTGNMTRDANAFWQRGIAGNFSQFYTYNARIAELMIGRQTTAAEKARLFAMYGTLWGLPLFAAPAAFMETGDAGYAVSGALPFGDDLAKEALKRGYKVHEGFTGMLYDGLVASFASFVTGRDLDFGSRYGVNPFTLPENIQDNVDKYGALSGLGLSAFGASGSIGAQIVHAMYPLFGDLAQVGGMNGATTLLANDVTNAAREVSTANLAYRMGSGFLGMSYISKNGTVISEPSKDPWMDAAFALTGAQDTDEVDAYTMIDVMKSRKENIDKVSKRAREIQGYIKNATEVKDWEQVKDLNKQLEALVASSTLMPKERWNILYTNNNADTLKASVARSFAKKYPEGTN